MKQSNNQLLKILYGLIGLMIVALIMWWGVWLTVLNKQELQPIKDLVSYVQYEHTIPVVTIETEPENLWDAEKGIYVEGNNTNYLQSGKDWERPATISYYQPTADHKFKLGFSRNIGLRLHGHALRSMPQKAFRIYFKDEYSNNSKLEYPLFDEDNEVFSTLILRNGDQSKSMIRDQVASQLVAQAGRVDVLRGKPVAVYLNGEYWGLYFLQERFDETYFREKYDVDDDYLALLSAELGHEPKGQLLPEDEQSEADVNFFNQLITDAKRCTDCASANSVSKQLDVENTVDYFIFEMFFSNADWPYNNLKAWRYKTESNFPPESELISELDGRFRWLAFDFDASMGAGSHTIEDVKNAAAHNTYGLLIDNDFPLRNLFYSNQFATQYQDRVDQLLDTVLSPQNTNKVVDDIAGKIDQEMVYQTQRWGGQQSTEGRVMVENVETWEKEIELLKIYLEERGSFFRIDTTQFFRTTP